MNRAPRMVRISEWQREQIALVRSCILSGETPPEHSVDVLRQVAIEWLASSPAPTETTTSDRRAE